MLAPGSPGPPGEPGWAAGAPADPPRLCLRSSSLGRRQPGYKMAGKGWDRRRSARAAARSTRATAGGEHQSWGLLAPRLPPCPGPSAGRPPPARASLGSTPTQAAAENGCQSGASRHAAPGGGARSSPAPCSPPPLRDSSEAQTLADSGAWGRDGGGREATCRLGLTGWGGVDGRQYGKGTFLVPTPTNVSSVLVRSRCPGGGNVNGA